MEEKEMGAGVEGEEEHLAEREHSAAEVEENVSDAPADRRAPPKVEVGLMKE